VGALAAAGALSRRGSRSRGGGFKSIAPVPQGFSTSSLDFVRGYSLQQIASQDEDEGLYHVTTNLPAVLEAGRLKSRLQLRGQGRKQAGLGGGLKNQAADMVSVGIGLSGALAVLQAVQVMALAVHGKISSAEALSKFNKASRRALDMVEDEIEYRFSSYDEEGEHYNDAVRVEQRMGSAQNEVLSAEPGPYLYAALQRYEQAIDRAQVLLGISEPGEFSTCMAPVGFTEPAHKFEHVRPENVGLIKLAGRRGAKTDLIEGECELRFKPSDLAIVAVWRTP
jgi:tetratricopeptide (TPR) repeat protein